ncbi:MAG: PKD domain-containing protein [Candidatus Bipolaricaulota bacterium]|nr:PKD domain-containing protein [Candidatus Bipolaricaulota bacterium]
MFKRRLGLALGVLSCLLLAGCEFFQQPPVASFVVHYSVVSTDPMVVDLDASASSDPNGDVITAYMWTFGDDVTILTPLDTTKTVTVPVLRVRYPLEGAYPVQLLVRNELGETSAIVSGTVTLPHE